MGNEFQEAVKRLMLLRSLGVPSITTTKERPLPSQATWHLCGSREKIELMRQRVELGEQVFHVDDSKAEVAPGYESGIVA